MPPTENAPSGTPEPTAPAPSALASLEKVAAASSAVDPGPAPSAAPASPPAAPTAPAPTAPAGTSAPRGPIPYDRHEAILGNLREKYRWAESLDQRKVYEALNIFESLQKDPRAVYQYLGSMLQNQGPQDDPDPQPDLVTTDGKQKTYSEGAVKKLLENQEKRLVRRLSEQFKPTQEWAEQEQQRRVSDQRTYEASQTAKLVIDQMRQYPHFKEHESDVAQAVAAMPDDVRQRVGAVGALMMAWQKVFAEKVLPTLGQQTENQVLSTMRRAAATSAGSVVPAQGVGGNGRAIKDGDLTSLAARLREYDAR